MRVNQNSEDGPRGKVEKINYCNGDGDCTAFTTQYERCKFSKLDLNGRCIFELQDCGCSSKEAKDAQKNERKNCCDKNGMCATMRRVHLGCRYYKPKSEDSGHCVNQGDMGFRYKGFLFRCTSTEARKESGDEG